MVKELNIFKNSNVLITGHTGFKGSWLLMILHQLGANITGVSLSELTKPSHFDLLTINKKIKDYRIDICDQKSLKKVIINSQPDFIFHLAAQSLLPLSYDYPYRTWQSNLIGTVNILESLRSVNKSCIAIFITSDKCYENIEQIKGYVETDRMGGSDPYSASKASAEFAIQSYVSSFFKKNGNVKVGIARAGNVIGGGDWSQNRIVPDCIKAWSKNSKVKIRNIESTRPWQHVLEPLSGYLNLSISLLQNSSLHGEAFNFGPYENTQYSVRDLLDKMSNLWGEVEWTSELIEKPIKYESKLLQLDCKKAYEKLNWRSSLDFEDTIKNTICWYKEYYKNDKKLVKNITKLQIKNFFTNFKNHGLVWK